MAADAVPGPPIRFDLFELDPGSCQLRRRDALVDLPPQALKILVLLASRPDELVTRKEIKQTLWPGQTYGDFDSRLNFAIKKLREALGDDAEQPRYVQTVRNAGYRFIAPVREPPPIFPVISDSEDHSLGNPRHAAPGAIAAGKRMLPGRSVFMLIAVAAIASTAGVLFLVRSHTTGQPGLSGVRVAIEAASPEPPPEILSVTLILPRARQRIVIKGEGFGLHVPYARTDSPYLAIRDLTRHWAAGRIAPHNWDEVMVDVESWSNTEITVSGFSGDYGRNGWALGEGDEVEIAVWNPQSGVGPAFYHVKVIAQSGATNR
jgi:DNA-binding winged helix-turn-helix (wHTH) protein